MTTGLAGKRDISPGGTEIHSKYSYGSAGERSLGMGSFGQRSAGRQGWEHGSNASSDRFDHEFERLQEMSATLQSRMEETKAAITGSGGGGQTRRHRSSHRRREKSDRDVEKNGGGSSGGAQSEIAMERNFLRSRNVDLQATVVSLRTELVNEQKRTRVAEQRVAKAERATETVQLEKAELQHSFELLQRELDESQRAFQSALSEASQARTEVEEARTRADIYAGLSQYMANGKVPEQHGVISKLADISLKAPEGPTLDRDGQETFSLSSHFEDGQGVGGPSSPAASAVTETETPTAEPTALVGGVQSLVSSILSFVPRARRAKEPQEPSSTWRQAPAPQPRVGAEGVLPSTSGRDELTSPTPMMTAADAAAAAEMEQEPGRKVLAARLHAALSKLERIDAIQQQETAKAVDAARVSAFAEADVELARARKQIQRLEESLDASLHQQKRQAAAVAAASTTGTAATAAPVLVGSTPLKVETNPTAVTTTGRNQLVYERFGDTAGGGGPLTGLKSPEPMSPTGVSDKNADIKAVKTLTSLLYVVRSAVNFHHSNPAMVIKVLPMLASLSAEGGVREALLDAGLLGGLSKVLDRHSHVKELQLNTLHLLVNFCEAAEAVKDDQLAVKLALDVGLRIVTVMNASSDSSEIQEMGCHVVEHMATAGKLGLMPLLNIGLAKRLRITLESFLGDSAVFEAAGRAAIAVAMAHPDVEKVMVSNRVPAAFAAALARVDLANFGGKHPRFVRRGKFSRLAQAWANIKPSAEKSGPH